MPTTASKEPTPDGNGFYPHEIPLLRLIYKNGEYDDIAYDESGQMLKEWKGVRMMMDTRTLSGIVVAKPGRALHTLN